MAVTAIINFLAPPGKRMPRFEFLKRVQGSAIAAGWHSIAVHSVIGSDDTVVEVEHGDTKEHSSHSWPHRSNPAHSSLSMSFSPCPSIFSIRAEEEDGSRSSATDGSKPR